MRVLNAVLITAISSLCSAQTTQPDPVELLQTANQLATFNNGAGGPWHLHATYSILNGDGKQTESGTYEVFWAGLQKNRQSFASKKFTQTDYVTDKGTFRTGALEWPMTVEQRVPDALFFRLPASAPLENFNVEMRPRTSGGTTLRCITVIAKGAILSATTIIPTFCLESESPILRSSSGTGRNVIEALGSALFNNLVLFRGHPVSRDILISVYDHPSLKIHVDVLEDLAPGSDGLFTPPANASSAPPARAYVGQQKMDARIVKKSKPSYGIVLNTNGFDGRGVLDVVVGKDGSVKGAKSVMGPTLFESGAIGSVLKQTYQPVLVNGQPVEVETEVSYTMESRH